MTEVMTRLPEVKKVSDSSSDFRVSSFPFFSSRFWPATAAIWTASVLALALSPNAAGGWLMKTLGDKVLHGFAFFVGCFLWAKALQTNPRRTRIATAISGALIAMVIGFAVEGFQKFVPTRQADMWDILADSLGVLPALAYLTISEALRKPDGTSSSNARPRS